MNVARQAALKAGVPGIEVPAETVNRVCGSGLQAVVHAVEGDPRRLRGHRSSPAAPSRCPMRPYLLKQAGAGGTAWGTASSATRCSTRGSPVPSTPVTWGMTAEEIATRGGPFRVPNRMPSPPEARRAPPRQLSKGDSSREIVRASTYQKSGTVRFEGGRVSSRRHHGGAARRAPSLPSPSKGPLPPATPRASTTAPRRLVVTTRGPGKADRRTPARPILAYASTGVDPMIMGIGPVPAVEGTRGRAGRGGWTGRKCDLFELNEAFAAQSLRGGARPGTSTRRRWNVNGGAIALGHPIGARHGARILTTLLYALQSRQLQIRCRRPVCRRRHGHRDGD